MPTYDSALSSELVSIIRERFQPFATFAKGLYAGPLLYGDRAGHLFLSDESWQWMPDRPVQEPTNLSDDYVSRGIQIEHLLRYLLLAVANTSQLYLDHLDALAVISHDLNADIGVYLTDPDALHKDAIVMQSFTSFPGYPSRNHLSETHNIHQDPLAPPQPRKRPITSFERIMNAIRFFGLKRVS